MDQIVVQLPDDVQTEVGAAVVVMGGDPASAAPSIAEMADLMGTNAYEVVVGIRGRVPRLFAYGGEIVAARISSDAATLIQFDTDRAGA
jgi:alanine racemase